MECKAWRGVGLDGRNWEIHYTLVLSGTADVPCDTERGFPYPLTLKLKDIFFFTWNSEGCETFYLIFPNFDT